MNGALCISAQGSLHFIGMTLCEQLEWHCILTFGDRDRIIDVIINVWRLIMHTVDYHEIDDNVKK